MDLTKILKRLTGKTFEYDKIKDMTLTYNRIIGVCLSGTDINKDFPEGYPNSEQITWHYSKKRILEALDILEGDIKIFFNDKKASPLIFEDDVFQVGIAPKITEVEDD